MYKDGSKIVQMTCNYMYGQIGLHGISMKWNTYSYISILLSPFTFSPFIIYISIFYYQTSRFAPLASSVFAAIGCFRALPYDGIYIMKNYSKLTKKNPRNFILKFEVFFCIKPFPDQESVNKKRIIQIDHPFRRR